jgi:pentatricopeptide repeat protein
VWCAGMNACVGLGYVDEAAELLRTMQKSGMRADVRAYNILLKGQANARSLSSMQATMSDMERMQVAPSVVTYNILIDAFANEGLLEQVMLTVATPCVAPHLNYTPHCHGRRAISFSLSSVSFDGGFQDAIRAAYVLPNKAAALYRQGQQVIGATKGLMGNLCGAGCSQIAGSSKAGPEARFVELQHSDKGILPGEPGLGSP